MPRPNFRKTMDCKFGMATDLRNASFIVGSRFPLRDADELLRLVGPTQDRAFTGLGVIFLYRSFQISLHWQTYIQVCIFHACT